MTRRVIAFVSVIGWISFVAPQASMAEDHVRTQQPLRARTAPGPQAKPGSIDEVSPPGARVEGSTPAKKSYPRPALPNVAKMPGPPAPFVPSPLPSATDIPDVPERSLGKRSPFKSPKKAPAGGVISEAEGKSTASDATQWKMHSMDGKSN